MGDGVLERSGIARWKRFASAAVVSHGIHDRQGIGIGDRVAQGHHVGLHVVLARDCASAVFVG